MARPPLASEPRSVDKQEGLERPLHPFTWTYGPGLRHHSGLYSGTASYKRHHVQTTSDTGRHRDTLLIL